MDGASLKEFQPFRSRTVYDVAPLAVASAPQLLPPNTYDVVINGQRYTVVSLQGFQESQYLQELRKEVTRLDPGDWRDEPVALAVSCGRSGAAVTEAVRDALFLALAYKITEVDGLSIDELLCLVEIADEYRLPVDYAKILRAGVATVKTVDEFFMLVNATSTFYPRIREYGETSDTVANMLAAGAERVLMLNGDNPANFERVAESLIFSWMPARSTLNENVSWKRDLMRQFGRRVGEDRSLPGAIMGSYVVNLTDDLVDVSSVLLSQNFIPVDLGEVHRELQANDEFRDIHDQFAARVRTMYGDLFLSIGEEVRKRLARCFCNWLAAAKMPLNVDLEFVGGIVSSYPFLEYNPVSGDYFYSVATGQVEQLSGLPVFYSQTVPLFEELVRKSAKITVTLDEELIKRYGLNPTDQSVCSNFDTLSVVGYPFVKLGGTVPVSQFNQFGQCVVSTSLKTIVDKAVKDPNVTRAVNDMVC